MNDSVDNNDGSLTEWAEELEKFLGGRSDASGPSLRQQKETMLKSLATQMIESVDTNDKAEDSAPVLRMETKSYKTSHSLWFIYFVIVCIVSFGFIKYGLCQGKSLKLCWNNNIQDWIYPVLRAVRLLALPVIQYFPWISDVHEDTCLVDNPLYWDQEVDCTLCQGVGVVTLSEAQQFEELFYHKGVPVVIQDAVPRRVTLPTLRRLYRRHREDVAAGSGGRLASLHRLLTSNEHRLPDMHGCIQWRLLRVSAVRHLRRLFVRPYFISRKTEVSLHRYIYICGDQGQRFPLPMTEFANVWIGQHSGTRQVQLTPSSECSGICRPVSALLRPGDTLFYNWRYWRAWSLPVAAGRLAALDTSRAEVRRSEADSPPTGSVGADPAPSAAPEASRTCPAADGWRGWRRTSSAARSPADPPAVGITFVGSFY